MAMQVVEHHLNEKEQDSKLTLNSASRLQIEAEEEEAGLEQPAPTSPSKEDPSPTLLLPHHRENEEIEAPTSTKSLQMAVSNRLRHAFVSNLTPNSKQYSQLNRPSRLDVEMHRRHPSPSAASSTESSPAKTPTVEVQDNTKPHVEVAHRPVKPTLAAAAGIYGWYVGLNEWLRNLPRATVLSAISVFLYIGLALSLVLFNKWMLSTAGFHFPLTLSISYSAVKTLLSGAFVFTYLRKDLIRTAYWPTKITFEFFFHKIVPVGIFFGLDVGLTNMAFRYSSVSLTEIVKSGIPVLVLGFSAATHQEKLTFGKVMVMVSLTLGICLASFGEVGFSSQGFMAAVGATISGACKLVLAERMFRNNHEDGIHPMLTLMYFSPVVILTLIIPTMMFEAYNVAHSEFNFWATVAILFLGGLIGFIMVLAELVVVEHTSALTLCVVGAAKIVLVITVASFVFNEPMELINFAGCAVCMLGIALYNYIKWLESIAKRKENLQAALSPAFAVPMQVLSIQSPLEEDSQLEHDIPSPKTE